MGNTKRKGSQFQPGQSGNPDGRPKGGKDKRTRYRELFQEHAEDLIAKAVDMAKAGDSTMMRACLDRIVSPFRAVDPPVRLHGINGTLSEKGERIITSALGEGDLSASEAAALLTALAAQARIREVDELEKRIEKLEKRNGN